MKFISIVILIVIVFVVFFILYQNYLDSEGIINIVEYSSSDTVAKEQKTKNNEIKKEKLVDSLLIKDEDLKWRLLNKNFDDTLRYMRNTIFAKHGYIFKSEDLNKYFNSKRWYRPNPNYNDSLLTVEDSLNMKILMKYEHILHDLTEADSVYLGELFSFRDNLNQDGYDKTTTKLVDITNDGVIDTFQTRISFTGIAFKIVNTMRSEKEELWSEEYNIYGPDEHFYINKFTPTYPRLSYYQYLLKEDIHNYIPNIRYISGKTYFTETDDSDTLIYSSLLSDCQNTSQEFKEYLYTYSGYEVVFSNIEFYDVKIWYPPLKSFIRLWSGP